MGPLPVSQNNRYLLTIIDRFTRWPEAIPLPDSQAATCAMALLQHWIARFGVPEDITSDRGPQFTSSVWAEFQKLFGIKVHQTTSYHPQANGMVERLHRQLKASLKARTTTADWFVVLPLVLLGIRSSWRVDPGCSPAELVYGTTIRLPGEFLQASESFTMEPDIAFVKQLNAPCERFNLQLHSIMAMADLMCHPISHQLDMSMFDMMGTDIHCSDLTMDPSRSYQPVTNTSQLISKVELRRLLWTV